MSMIYYNERTKVKFICLHELVGITSSERKSTLFAYTSQSELLRVNENRHYFSR